MLKRVLLYASQKSRPNFRVVGVKFFYSMVGWKGGFDKQEGFGIDGRFFLRHPEDVTSLLFIKLAVKYAQLREVESMRVITRAH
jgi:hypothetical protein